MKKVLINHIVVLLDGTGECEVRDYTNDFLYVEYADGTSKWVDRALYKVIGTAIHN